MLSDFLMPSLPHPVVLILRRSDGKYREIIVPRTTEPTVDRTEPPTRPEPVCLDVDIEMDDYPEEVTWRLMTTYLRFELVEVLASDSTKILFGNPNPNSLGVDGVEVSTGVFTGLRCLEVEEFCYHWEITDIAGDGAGKYSKNVEPLIIGCLALPADFDLKPGFHDVDP